MQILQSHHGPMLGYGFMLLRGENTPTTCRQSRKEKNKQDDYFHFHLWWDPDVSKFYISVELQRSAGKYVTGLRYRSYLADVLVVATCILLLQEKLVPHPSSPDSFVQLLSPECCCSVLSVSFPCPLSIQWQSIQRQAQTENTEYGQKDSPHFARSGWGMQIPPVFSRPKLYHPNGSFRFLKL